MLNITQYFKVQELEEETWKEFGGMKKFPNTMNIYEKCLILYTSYTITVIHIPFRLNK